jgi:hypothetical protein
MTEIGVRRASLSKARRYSILAYGAFGTMLDVGLLALGAVLVGLSIAVVLAGFGLAEVAVGLTTAPLLVSGLVIAVAGLFCLGVASEGPLGRGRRLVGFKVWEVGIGRTLAVFLIGLAILLLQGMINGFLDGLPSPLFLASDAMRSVGIAGMVVMPLIGVPLSLAAREYGAEWGARADVPVLFSVWVVASLIILS